MKKFEYLNKITYKTELLSDYALNQLGNDGWELISLYISDYSAIYVFKKEI